MEKFLVVVLCELELLGGVIGQIAVGATLARLVGLILFRAHRHDILYTLLNHSPLDLVDA